MTCPRPVDRSDALALLVTRAPSRGLGRTAVMKLLYFLQELKSIPLGYHFRLFDYGPFDQEVLADLATAVSRDVVNEETVIYPKGYGYKISPSPGTARMAASLAKKNPELAAAVDEILESFGSLSAAELELRSTVLFVDREFARQGGTYTTGSITQQVRRVKPHFSETMIQERVIEFEKKGRLQSVQPGF